MHITKTLTQAGTVRHVMITAAIPSGAISTARTIHGRREYVIGTTVQIARFKALNRIH